MLNGTANSPVYNPRPIQVRTVPAESSPVYLQQCNFQYTIIALSTQHRLCFAGIVSFPRFQESRTDRMFEPSRKMAEGVTAILAYSPDSINHNSYREFNMLR